MKLRTMNLKKLFSKNDYQLLEADLNKKFHQRENEIGNFKNKVYLLQQEFNKKRIELNLYYRNQLEKIKIEYQQKMIELQ